MVFRILVCALVFVALTARTAAALDLFPARRCQELWLLGKPRVHIGFATAPPINLYPNSKWFLLGSGVKGGDVYRVVPFRGEPFVVKKYRDDQKGQLDSDLRAFQILHEAFEPMAADPPLGIVGHERIASNLLKLTNLEGETAEGFVNRLANSWWNRRFGKGKIRKARTILYNKLLATKALLDAWSKRKKAEGSLVDYQSNLDDRGWLTVFIKLKGPSENEEIIIYLKPDNILITSDGRPIIIDPF